MDQSPCCWDKEIGATPSCPCNSCMLEDLAELPFYYEYPCPIDNHANDLVAMIRTCNRTQSAILRIQSIVLTEPDMVNVRIMPKILKRQLLLASLAIYDASFSTYLGPTECNCGYIILAQAALKRLHDTCIVAGLPVDTMWSFQLTVPRPIHSIMY